MYIALLNPPRGLRDYWPEIWSAIRWLGEKFIEIGILWGYIPIEAPVIESLSILEKKAGPDVVNEIYWFKDKGGRSLGLRFDYTVPIARAVASRPELPKPLKYCYFGRSWRYDEPQAGRWREFWQFGVEFIGSDKIYADAEIMALAAECIKSIGIENFKIMVCDRRLVESALNKIGVPRNLFSNVLRIIDKRKKISTEEFYSMLGEVGLKHIADEINDFSSMIISLKDASKFIKKYDSNLANIFEELSKLLDLYGYLEYFYLDCSIVRGLEYYTGIVFEIFGENGKWSRLSLGGGGRYDELIGLYRSPTIPSTGFALGIDRIAMYMEEKNIVKWNIPKPLVKIYVINKELEGYGFKVLKYVRENGISCELDFYSKSIRDALKNADKRGIRYIIIIGKKEVEMNLISIKDLSEGVQKTIRLEDLKKIVSRV